jgi:hypothetical protein
MANEFIIKINKDSKGNEVSLSSMTYEAADALKIFIESLSDFAKNHQNSSELRLSLKDGCVESALVYPESDTIVENDILSVINGESYNNEHIKLLKNIQDKIKLNGLDYSIIHKVNDESIDLTSIFKAKDFPLRRTKVKEWSEELLFLEGKLFNSGGKITINIHLETIDNDYKIECNEIQAKILNNFLFDKVYVSVLKIIKNNQKPTYQLIDIYLKKELFNEYSDLYKSIWEDKSLKRFDIIYNKITQTFNSTAISNGNISKIMRLFNHPHADRGMLRTVLMALKPIKNHEDLDMDLYHRLAKILRSGSKNKFI